MGGVITSEALLLLFTTSACAGIAIADPVKDVKHQAMAKTPINMMILVIYCRAI
jgi:hypothetical protein